MKKEIFDALVALVGPELASEFAQQVDSTNRAIAESGMIIRTKPAPPPAPTPTPAKRVKLVLGEEGRKYLEQYRKECEAEAQRLKAEDDRLHRELPERFHGIQRAHPGGYKLPHLRHHPEARDFGTLADKADDALNAMGKKSLHKSRHI